MLFLRVLSSRRINRGVLLWAFVCLPAAGMGGAPFDSLMACAQIAPDAARLACFDREAAEISKKNPQPSASAAPTAEQQFGLGTTPGAAATPTVLHAHIVSVSRQPIERQVFVLDNAQTWQQIELDPDFAVHMGQEVTISKGALGSFWLSTKFHRATRVKRTK